MENFEKKIESALASQNPIKNIRELLTNLLQSGVDRKVILAKLDEYRLNLLDDNEGKNDVVLDVMDYLTGWCGPDAKL